MVDRVDTGLGRIGEPHRGDGILVHVAKGVLAEDATEAIVVRAWRRGVVGTVGKTATSKLAGEVDIGAGLSLLWSEALNRVVILGLVEDM